VDVTLLGTGSADGWPNPFCRCASCRAAGAAGLLRSPTSALVDATILLDCGPEAPRQALRAGADLTGLRAVLVTHAHPDHFDPAMLLYRGWATDEPLEIVGPQPVVDACAPWLSADTSVTLTAVKPGVVLDLHGYRVRALRASHLGPGQAVLYDVLGPDGHRLLYATDTGPLTAADATHLAGARFDIALLEETFGDRPVPGADHLNLQTFAQTLRLLRGVGAVEAGTDVVAVHLGHHNPPPDELSRRLESSGARTVPDGTTLVATRPARGGPAAWPRRPRRTLITGGARSGKSLAAERLLHAHADVVYVATAARRPDEPEWDRRIEEHRRRRPNSWSTRETLDLAGALESAGPPVLIDCMTLWLSRTLDQRGAWEEGADFARIEHELEAEFSRVARAWRSTPRTVVAVTNEVGSGVVPDTRSGVWFRDLLGRLNAMVAAESDEVLWCVAGRVVRL
jgi:adenosylcobinamide kinase/adenosylcobinamide-phosphate guanylyltransferase